MKSPSLVQSTLPYAKLIKNHSLHHLLPSLKTKTNFGINASYAQNLKVFKGINQLNHRKVNPKKTSIPSLMNHKTATDINEQKTLKDINSMTNFKSLTDEEPSMNEKISQDIKQLNQRKEKIRLLNITSEMNNNSQIETNNKLRYENKSMKKFIMKHNSLIEQLKNYEILLKEQQEQQEQLRALKEQKCIASYLLPLINPINDDNNNHSKEGDDVEKDDDNDLRKTIKRKKKTTSPLKTKSRFDINYTQEHSILINTTNNITVINHNLAVNIHKNSNINNNSNSNNDNQSYFKNGTFGQCRSEDEN